MWGAKLWASLWPKHWLGVVGFVLMSSLLFISYSLGLCNDVITPDLKKKAAKSIGERALTLMCRPLNRCGTVVAAEGTCCNGRAGNGRSWNCYRGWWRNAWLSGSSNSSPSSVPVCRRGRRHRIGDTHGRTITTAARFAGLVELQNIRYTWSVVTLTCSFSTHFVAFCKGKHCQTRGLSFNWLSNFHYTHCYLERHLTHFQHSKFWFSSAFSELTSLKSTIKTISPELRYL